MMIRSAFWIGKPIAGAEQQLRSLLSNELVPAMRLFPGVAAIKLLWPRERQDSPPDIWCQVLVEYTSAESVQQMMNSEERAHLRPRVIAAAKIFDGHVSHINYETDGL